MAAHEKQGELIMTCVVGRKWSTLFNILFICFHYFLTLTPVETNETPTIAVISLIRVMFIAL